MVDGYPRFLLWPSCWKPSCLPSQEFIEIVLFWLPRFALQDNMTDDEHHSSADSADQPAVDADAEAEFDAASVSSIAALTPSPCLFCHLRQRGWKFSPRIYRVHPFAVWSVVVTCDVACSDF